MTQSEKSTIDPWHTCEAALLLVGVVVLILGRGRSEADAIRTAGERQAKQIKTRVAEARFISGEIDVYEYDRQLQAIWG